MKYTFVAVSTAALCAFALPTTTAAPATPDQVGVYTGTAKQTYYDLGTGQKISETVPCVVTIGEVNNTITFTVDQYSETSPGCPLSRTMGGFYHGSTGGPAFTAVFKFSGKGTKTSIKGTFNYVNPYVLESGKFKLKKLPINL